MNDAIASLKSLRIVVSLGVGLAIAACAHPQADEEDAPKPPAKFKYESKEPFYSDANAAVFAPFAIMYQLAEIPVGNANPRIFGTCLVKNEPKDFGSPCPETYIELVDRKQPQPIKIWVDGSGKFEIPIKAGEIYSLQAVSDSYALRSKAIEVSRPGKVTLTIHPESHGR